MADNDDSETGNAAPDKEKDKNNTRNRTLLTGAAIGIGSAALVAALLYAKRNRKNDRT